MTGAIQGVSHLAPFQPLPWQIAPWRDQSPVLLLTGSAGGGKSRLAAEKLHGFCLRYPGAMALAMRKIRQSMTNSTVLFIERSVIGRDPRVNHYPSKLRFEYDNGSILAYGGMANEEQREQLRSIGQQGGLDMVWLEEANGFTEADFNEVLGRLRGRAAPWSQLILSTNPDAPMHWINQRLILGKQATVYYSRARDNPHNPVEYLDRLGMMTGLQAQRLRDGLWVQAEGAVYPEFGPDNIVTDEPDREQPFELAFDDGYAVDPRAILFVQRQSDRVLVFDEIYHLQKLEEESIGEVLARCTEYAGKVVPIDWRQLGLAERAIWCREEEIPLPDLAVGSTEANQLMRRFRMADIPARGGTHTPMTEGVKLVRGLVRDANGRAVVQVHPRCKRFIGEMQGYQMKPGQDRPEDKDDHGPDAFRYWCWLRMRR